MGLQVDERIVAGGDADGLVVHHLVLRGSPRAIGRHLCELVRARYGVCAEDPPLPFATHRERVSCTASFAPPGSGARAHPVVAATIEVAGSLGRPRRGEPPPVGRPYVMELHPDEGHPSLAVCAFDLENAALDGVNGEGLVVVAVPEPVAAAGSGAGALRVVRQLLDRCASAAEAREALRDAGLHAGGGRWLVADRRGDAFVLEAGRGDVRRVDAAGGPLAVAARLEDAALRTLWHGEYDPVERRLAARFFVGAGEFRRGEAAELRFQLG
jgi:hypothetical protein